MAHCVSNFPATYAGGADFDSNRTRFQSLIRCRRTQGYGKNFFDCDETAEAVNALYAKNEEKNRIPVTKVAGLKEGYDSPPEEETSGNPSLFKFLEDFGIKLDTTSAYQLLVLGGGGVVALSLLAGVVGAVDSIPLLPNALELVGLGYSIWFTIRYLIFKENRDELVHKVKQIKSQVLGSDEEA